MRIALVHSHLRPGGVTRVMEQTVQALRRSRPGELSIVVLTGEAAPTDSPLIDSHAVVEDLGYRDQCTPGAPAELAASLTATAARCLGGNPDVWHFHNPLLGKNVALPGAILLLAGQGANLLLHLHDFAEDGRPDNYRQLFSAPRLLQTGLYPSAGQVHYAVLAPRDAAILRRAGLPQDRLWHLPNPVAPLPLDPAGSKPAFAQGRRFFLYPSRGIRRKNLGELLLLAQLTRHTHAWATTLSPANSRWQAGHAQWRAVARRLSLPVELGLSDHPAHSFGSLVSAADGIVTTSVAEGFGLAFLEPWLSGKSVHGRRLPEITDSFEGLSFDHLYDRLTIPVKWIDSNRLHEKLDHALRASHSAYGRDLPDDAIERAYMAAVRSGHVDFGRLDEELQISVLEMIDADASRADSIARPEFSPLPPAQISAQADQIARQFAPGTYASRLLAVYDRLIATPPTEVSQLDGEAVLDAFLDAGRCRLLCL